MTFQHIDTVLAFIAIMLAASLVITAGTQLLISILGLRGANLRRSLADLFEGASDDHDAKRYSKVIARRVLHQPLVSGSVFSRFGVRLEGLPFVPADAAGKLRWAGSGIPLQPWLLGAFTGMFVTPVAVFVIKRLFSGDFCASVSTITGTVPFLNAFLSVCDHPWRTGAILGAVAGGLLSRWRLATSIRLDELVAVLERLSAPAGGTLPDPAQRAMLVIAGETRGHSRPKTNPVSAQMERMFRDASDEGDGGVAVAVEKAVSTQVAAAPYLETRVEGLNLWFQHTMERASQRFTVQARVITVLLSIVLVMGAHFDAIRIFQSLSSDAQTRAQLNASADALARQAEQLPRAHEGSRSVVPDVYRTAMVTALGLAPAPAVEPVKSKSRHSSHSSASSSSPAPVPTADAAPVAPGEGAPALASEPPAAADAGQAAPPPAPAASTETPKKERRHKSTASANKSSLKELAAVAPVSTEDPFTVEAKMKAARALQSRPGFASREDAALWLRGTLAGSPALDHLAASYEQEVNAELGGEGDKLIDQSASIKGELARTRLQFIPESWPGWTLNGHELPGMLLAIVFLSLSAPICYNLLKSIASLRPLRHIK